MVSNVYVHVCSIVDLNMSHMLYSMQSITMTWMFNQGM